MCRGVVKSPGKCRSCSWFKCCWVVFLGDDCISEASKRVELSDVWSKPPQEEFVWRPSIGVSGGECPIVGPYGMLGRCLPHVEWASG